MLIGSHLRASGMTRARHVGAGLWLTSHPGYRTPGRQKNRLVGAGISDRRSAVPYGYLAPQAWLLGIVSGGLSSTQLNGGSVPVFTIAGGRNGEATIAGTGALSAIGGVVASLIASLSGTGSVTDADMRAMLNALATLAGQGTVDADLEALGWVQSALTGVGNLALVPYATGELAAEILPGAASETLTPGQIADAVWGAAVAAYQDAGTMGEVQDNGSGSFPGGQFWP